MKAYHVVKFYIKITEINICYKYIYLTMCDPVSLALIIIQIFHLFYGKINEWLA